MADTTIDTTGYSTHILSTVKTVMSCKEILLYDKTDISNGKYKKISLYNLNEVYEAVIEGDKYLFLQRSEEESSDYMVFKYLHSNKEIERFNVIIYISPVNGQPIGYTEFRNSQGERRDTTIEIKLTAKVDDINIVLKNSLSSIPKSAKKYLGEELNEYVSATKALENIEKLDGGEKYYTKFISQAFKADKSIFLDSGAVIKTTGLEDSSIVPTLGLAKLCIRKNVNYSPYDYKFENFNVSYYGSDTVLCSWTDLNYSIISLTQINRFGDLIRYTKSSTGYYTLPENEYTSDPIVIDYITGKYIVCNSSSQVFDVEKREWVKLDSPIAFVDVLDRSSYLYQLPNSIKEDNFYRYLPDLKNIFYNYLDGESLRVKRKVGHWYILDVTYGNDENSLYLVTGISSSLYVTGEQLNNLIYLDDNTLILKTEDKYLLYTGEKRTMCTEEVEELKLLGEEFNYDTKAIEVNKSYELYTTELNNYRRSFYPMVSGVPDIITGFSGLLFYIDSKNKINFL